MQIDINASMIGMRYPMEVNVVGDSKATMQTLLPKLERKADRSWRDEIEQNVSDWWQTRQRRAMTEADPVNPQRLYWELSPRLPEDVIVTAGGGAMQINGMVELITVSRYWEVARPPADRAGAAQQRPQPGHLGDAGHGRRARTRSPTRGTPLSPPIGRWSSTPSAIRRSSCPAPRASERASYRRETR